MGGQKVEDDDTWEYNIDDVWCGTLCGVMGGVAYSDRL